MLDKEIMRETIRRLSQVRSGLLVDYPFFGRLLLHLQFGIAECGTAFTDMKNIVFDPFFAKRLSEDEIRFVLLHEVMHCVLHHCTRGRSLNHFLYNIACDIVVNSLIMETLSVTEFIIDGEPAMHLAPDKKEGREYSAEEVYDMLLKETPEEISEQYGDSGSSFDLHSVWDNIEGTFADDKWDEFLKGAAGYSKSGTGIPYSINRYLKEISHTPKTNWRQLLHDFIQYDRSDYVYQIPDKRFQGDIIMPSFQDNIYGDKVDKLWFLIDTSGSITDEDLSEAFCEIKDALEQIDDLSGELSFFDTTVSEPVPFGSVEDLKKINPLGGGGTSFKAIFQSLDEYYHDEFPKAIIILTDGYSEFPDESKANGVPVLWIIINSDVDAPWGECIHITK